MHPAVYRVYEEVCAQAGIDGPVLEVGAVPGEDCLLLMACLRHVPERVGLNLEGADCGDYRIVQGDANEMSAFADGRFAAALCNATLEHDPFFWKTVAEIRRVTAPGGFIAIGVPGYVGMGLHAIAPPRSLFGRLLWACRRGPYSDVIGASTVTLGVHNFPGDYYRFSEQAVREVFMGGLTGVATRVVMVPPRIIAWGRKP
jgi:SAM-dependent methyltransferase